MMNTMNDVDVPCHTCGGFMDAHLLDCPDRYEDYKEYLDSLLAKQFVRDESTMEADYDDLAMEQDTGSPIDTDRMARESALMGGKYHGPSNSAGMTSREYWDAWAEEQDERNDW